MKLVGSLSIVSAVLAALCPAALAAPAGALVAAAGPASGRASPLACTEDKDCLLSTFDCSQCGRCPGFPPYVISKRGLAQAEQECKAHPPPRLRALEPRTGGPRVPVLEQPACAPCQAPPAEQAWPLRTVCTKGRCEAVMGPRQRPGEVPALPATPAVPSGPKAPPAPPKVR